MKCQQCNYRQAAKGDDYCSRRCAEIANGVISPEEAKREANSRRRDRYHEDKAPPVELENPHQNRERHDGPTRRQHVRFHG